MNLTQRILSSGTKMIFNDRFLLKLLKISCITLCGWYVFYSSYSFAFIIFVILATVLLTNLLLSRNSGATSYWIDKTIYNLTYPYCLSNFFIIRDYKSFPTKLNYSVISRPMYIFIDNIIDKFVLSWHSDITQHKRFPKLVKQELVSIVHHLYSRCGLVNRYDIIQHVLDVYLIRVQEVTKKVGSFSSIKFTQLQHYAAQNQQCEDQYVRSMVDLLMRLSFSKVNYESEALRSILREILSTQVFTRVIDLLSEPSFLYKCIIELVKDIGVESSSISDDDKEFLDHVSSAKNVYEIVIDDKDKEDSETILEGSLDNFGYYQSQKFRIPKVRLFGEGLSRFAVYVIEYSDGVWEQQENSKIVHHFVGRRFKEFFALHDRLKKNKITKQLMEKVNFPSKEPISSFPFNRLDQDFLASRKDLFTQYLNDISKHNEIVNCEDFKEFLGYQCDEIKVFKRKTSSFIETKLGLNISKVSQVLKSLTQKLSTMDSRDDSLFDDENNELYATYKDAMRHTKKLASLSREHTEFLRAPPNADITETLEKFINENMDNIDKSSSGNTLERFINPDNLCVSIQDSRFCESLLRIIQQWFSDSGTLLAKYGFSIALSTILHYPINRYVINKINTLTSQNYWFVYLTKLNQIIFSISDSENKTISEPEFRNCMKELLDSLCYQALNGDIAIGTIAQSFGNQERNKAMIFLILDYFLGMFVPELQHELKNLYKYQ